MIRIAHVALLVLLGLPAVAHAWWNAEWTQRRKINVDATQVAGLKGPVAQAVVPIRLHSGNFPFVEAKEDGSDLRFLSGDDKTALRHHVELFDPVNELAIIWVQVPRVAPGAQEPIWLYYGNAKAPAADDAKGTWDGTQVLALHLSDRDAPRDVTGFGNNPTRTTAQLGAEGVLARGAKFQVNAVMEFAESPSLRLSPQGGFTFSAWVRPAAAQNAVLYQQAAGGRSFRVMLAGDRLVVRVAPGAGKPIEVVSSEPVAAGAWQHVAVTAKDRVILYVNGNAVGAQDVPLPEIAGPVTIGAAPGGGEGFTGELDEVQLASTERPADWVVLAAATQGAQTSVVTVGDAEAGASESASYLRILLDAVTLDGWIVIGILMVMMVIAFVVMIVKGFTLARIERANRIFRERFAEEGLELIGVGGTTRLTARPSVGAMGVPRTLAETFRGSTLARLLDVAGREIERRIAARGAARGTLVLTPQAVDVLKAALDARYVRETASLNSRLVLLTIAISGGPFLGLLGTVVGVMITFAAIAAAGDVNVNAIAPGIAAALVATVAGLAVAIPALFGYNWLASRIKEVTNDMQVFIDEVVTRIAEQFS